MKVCQIHYIRGYRSCENPAHANIGLEVASGTLTIDVCKEHLDMLTEALPTNETELAQGQKSGRIPIPEYE